MKALIMVGLCLTMGVVFLVGFGSRDAALAQQSSEMQSAEKLPADVHPESLSRMPWATKEEFTNDAEKQAFDRMVAAAPQVINMKGPIGPTGTRVHDPIVAESYFTAYSWMGKNAGLEPRYVELAIMISTRESGNEYEWTLHEKSSASVLPREDVEAIRNRKDTKGLDEKDAVLIQYGREMYHEPKVSSKTFADAQRLFGPKNTLTATLIMAHYTANALMMHAYDQQLPPGAKHPFPNP